MSARPSTALALERGEHPGAVVRRTLDAHALTVTAAAAALRVGRVALSKLVNGRASLSGDMAIRLDKAFGLDMTELLALQAAFDIAAARRRYTTIHVPHFAPKDQR
jgi:addiction module HigA family antidote